MFEAYPAVPTLARDEIRLIRLLRGAWNDDIKCELVYDTLANVRPYQALSYVWGSSRRAKTLSLDGNSFAVTVNLESTLRHLRSPTQDILLWIDALCINQANDSERTHQVNLMGNIYRSSKGVLVYLGDGIGYHKRRQESKLDNVAPRATAFFDTAEDEPHIEKAMQPDAFQASTRSSKAEGDRRMHNTVDVFSFIRALSWVNHVTDIPWLTSNHDNPEIEKALLHIFESLRRLMHAPHTHWWGRIWVVQEVILPPQVTIVCGTVSAPWAMFARAASQSLYHLHHCCARNLEHLPRDFLNVLQDFGERVTDIDNLRKSCLGETNQPTRSSSQTDTSERRSLQTEQRSLTSLLRRFRGRKASDPRDKVYALLSLVHNDSNRPPLMPDYSLSSAEVYTLAAVESIYSSASLSVLTVDATRKYRQDLPSWVPDWEAPGDFSYNTRIDAMGMYDACAMYSVTTNTVTVRDRALIIEALNVDVVKECGPIMLSDSSETFLKTMMKWLFMERSVGAVTETAHTDKILWRVLCADVIFLPSELNDSADLFRRMEDADELMFVTWALTSRRSPFFDRKIPLRDYVSAEAILWMQIIDFETSIFDAKTEATGHMFFSLFPDQATRKGIIEDAIGITSLNEYRRMFDGSQRDSDGKSKERLVKYATFMKQQVQELDWEEYVNKMAAEGQSLDDLDEAQIMSQMLACEAQSQRNRLGAWKEVPWSRVFELVKPGLLRRVGSASKIGQIPYDVQASLIERSIVSATKARKFFITKRGHVGLGPADLKIDDVLFLLKGARTPLILRFSRRRIDFNDYCNSICQECIESYSDEDLMHIFTDYCSNCLKRAPLCSNCKVSKEAISYKVIGDCYALGFMDSDSIKEHMAKPESHSWMRVTLV